MTKRDEKRSTVDAFEMCFYRRILWVPWTDRKPNRLVLDKIRGEKMLHKSITLREMRVLRHD